MSYAERHITPVSANPISRAPWLASSTNRVYNGRLSRAVRCHAIQASRSLVSPLLEQEIQILDVQTLPAMGSKACLGLAVTPFQLGAQGGQLQSRPGIARARQRGGHAQQLEHPSRVHIGGLACEGGCPLDRAVHESQQLVVGGGRQALRVLGDVRVLDPLGGGRGHREPPQRLVGRVDEPLGVGRRVALGLGPPRRRYGRSAREAAERCGHQGQPRKTQRPHDGPGDSPHVASIGRAWQGGNDKGNDSRSTT